jgi:hypothetical protein
MARPTRTDSKVAALTLVRRSLEVRWGWRALLAFIPAAIGAGIVSRGAASAVVGAVLLAVALAVLTLPVFSPERLRRRLLAAASERVPDSDGWVTLIGTAGEAGELLTAPYSKRPCIAYWARKVAADSEDNSRDAGTDSEQRAASCDFALDLGEVRVLVTAADAHLAFDRHLGEVVSNAGDSLEIEPVAPAQRGRDRDRDEEILLRPGECVVVRGMLVRGAGDAPYRATARIVPARGRPVVIALGAAAGS